MMTSILVAIAAGATSALMFASLISGSLIAIVLAYLAPLPLLVAALGWGPFAAALGGIIATTVLGVIAGVTNTIFFAVWAALPAWWLGHLILLGRPTGADETAGGGSGQAIEWYPMGRVLLWIVATAGLIAIGWLLSLGTDADSIKTALRETYAPLGDGPRGRPGLPDALAVAGPPVITFVTTILLTLNVWLAGKIAHTSGRLRRPWPNLKSTALPPMTLAALSAATAFSFTGGLLAMIAQIASAGIMTAYAIIGLATVHTLSLALKTRMLWLGLAYLTLPFVWPMIILSFLGLADAVFGFRQRFMQRHRPAVPTT